MKVETGLEPSLPAPQPWAALFQGAEARRVSSEVLVPSLFPSTHTRPALSAGPGQQTLNESLDVDRLSIGAAQRPLLLAGNQEVYE